MSHKESVSVGLISGKDMWISKLGLNTQDHNILLSSTKWLNDNIIYASPLAQP